MTRLPVESWDVRAHEGAVFPKYRCPSMCAHPRCSRFADHAHHIVRRSFIGGDVAWVSFGDGPIVGNLAGLCWRHHEDITENRARILWEDRLRTYTYARVRQDGELESEGTLFPHPPIHGEKINEQEEHVHIVGPGGLGSCPECQRPFERPKETRAKEPAKRRKTWSLTVPDDAEEDGALVLDTLVESCAQLFGRDVHEPKLRYFVVAQALALVVQNGHKLGG